MTFFQRKIAKFKDDLLQYATDKEVVQDIFNKITVACYNEGRIYGEGLKDQEWKARLKRYSEEQLIWHL